MTGPTMEEICDDYFASMSPIASKIIEEKRKCMEKNRKNWERLTQDEKDSLLDAWFVDPDLKMRYEIRLHGKLPSNKDAPPESFPRLKVQGGTKTVHHTEHEDGSQSKGTCQQELPMISPASVTAASNRNNDVNYTENRLSLGLDTNDESRLIVSSSKSKGKDAKRATDHSEKPDKTRISRKDSKKREKENSKAREDSTPVVHQQPKATPTPFTDPSLDPSVSTADKNGKGPRREKSDKAKSPKTRHSGKTSPKRETKPKDRNVDLEGLIPPTGTEERSLEGINFSLGSTEGDGAPSSNLPGISFGLAGPTESSGLLPSPPPSATSQGSEPASAGQEGGGAGFDFLLSW